MAALRQVLASPIPPPPDGEVLTSDQWTTLLAIADTFIPAIQSSSTASTSSLSISPSEYAKLSERLLTETAGNQNADIVRDYLSESVSSIPAFKDLVHRMLGEYSRPDARKNAVFLLTVLGYAYFVEIQDS